MSRGVLNEKPIGSNGGLILLDRETLICAVHALEILRCQAHWKKPENVRAQRSVMSRVCNDYD